MSVAARQQTFEKSEQRELAHYTVRHPHAAHPAQSLSICTLMQHLFCTTKQIFLFLFCSTEYFFYFCMLKKAVIVTRDEETTINEGGLSIEIVPVWKWLLLQ